MHITIGYIAPSTAGLTTDFGILNTEENASKMLRKGHWRIPQQLSLNVKLEPHPVESTQTVEYINESVSRGVYPAYGPEVQSEEQRSLLRGTIVDKIDLVYQGQGEALFSSGEKRPLMGTDWTGATLQVDPSNVIFSKPFKTLSAGHTVIDSRHDGQGRILSPPGGYNIWARFPYGGYYHPKADLNKIEQVFTVINEEEQMTRMRIERSSFYMKEFTVYPPDPIQLPDLRIVFLDPPEPLEQATLLDVICNGTIPLRVHEGARVHEFISVDVEPMALPYLKLKFKYSNSH